MLVEKEKVFFYSYMFMAVLALTFLNKLAVLLLPLFYIVTYIVSSNRNGYEKSVALFFTLMIFISPVWVYEGGYWLNWFVSIVLFGSFLIVMSQAPVIPEEKLIRILRFCIALMMVNGVVGVIQYGLYRYDDAFIGFYGRAGLQGHGLAIIYAVFSAFLMYDNPCFSRKVSVSVALFFLLCFLLCFYGSGLAYLTLSLCGVGAIKASLKQKIIIVLLVPLVIVLVGAISPKTLAYNLNIVFLFADSLSGYFEGFIFSDMPRRLVFILEYFNLAVNDFTFFIFGNGPGTLNSRTSFLLNGDYSSLSILPISIHPLAAEYVFPLWGTDILSQGYSDGSMNQPFSSFFALLGEYGAILTIAYFWVLWRAFMELKTKIPEEVRVFYLFFIGLLFMFENIIEYPEVLFSFVLIVQYHKSIDVNKAASES